MKIGVVSPGRQFGATTIAILFSEMLSIKMGTQIILTGLDSTDYSQKDYLGLPDKQEIVTSLSQASAMLDAGVIRGDEVKKYSIKRGEYFSALNPVVEKISNEKLTELITFIGNQLENNILVVDANLELGSREMDLIVDNMDYFIVVLSQSNQSIRKLDAWEELSNNYRDMKEKGVLYVINNYDINVASIRDTTRAFQIPKNKTSYVPYNPRIKKLANEEELYTMIDKFEQSDIMFANIKSGVKDMVDMFLKDSGISVFGDS